MIKILMFGDVMGRPGREAIAKILPKLKKKYNPDLILANGENLAHGLGITKKTVDQVLEAGVEVLTSGNHIFAKKEGETLLLDKNYPILRPANYPPSVPGKGFRIFRLKTKKILVINLVGRVFFGEDFDCPFRCADKILKETEKEKLDAIVVDFHGEATSECQAFGFYLDGRVSCILGTHTHIPTSDFKILEKGTAYVTDIGMVGSVNSVIGMEKEIVIEKFLKQMPKKLEVALEDRCEVNAVVVDIKNKNKAEKIYKISEVVDI